MVKARKACGQKRLLIVLLAVAHSSCGGSDAPSTPTSASATVLSVQSIQRLPSGAGVQHGTDFQFDAQGTFPSATEFRWQFGDGTTAVTATNRVTHIYSQTGTFSTVVEARAGSNSAAATVQVVVRSLVGRWVGTVSGHTGYPANRQIPIPRFELTVNGVTAPAQGARSATMSGAWSDDAGCRESRFGFLNQTFRYQADSSVGFGIESLICNDGDFYMTGVADAAFNRVEGTCSGGPNCRFVMVRQ